jgi:FkbM family methyltransferase
MRVALSRLVIEDGPLVSALRRIPGFQLCAKHLVGRILPTGYREWFQVRDGIGKGVWLKLNPRTGGQYYRGNADMSLQKVLRDYLRPGMVFYDLGSNNGFFSLVAARIVGATGRVVAFEAEQELGRGILENIERNDVHNTRLVQSAVWSHSGIVDFSPADPCASPDLGHGKVTSHANVKTVVVPSICLDDFVQTDRPPNLIKCDVEGAEVEVFRGARKVLAEYRPCVECEVHSSDNGRLLEAALGEMDYDVKWYSGNHFLATPRNLQFPIISAETT